MAARRPADRKSQIRSAATTLFLQRGYPNVSVADVTDSLGITAPALYYHYRSKQDLLLHALLDGLDTVDALINLARSLDDALRSLAMLAGPPRQLLAVWEREARYLRGPQRDMIRTREASIAAHLVPLLLTARPGLADADAELLAWAVLGTLGSCGCQRADVPGHQDGQHQDGQLTYRLAAVIAHCQLPGPRQHLGRRAGGAQVARGADAARGAGAARGAQGAGSRRDRLLTEAIALFDERGYQAVTMADIGEAAGIVASGVYRHFPGKTDLLVAAARCGAERIRAAADQARADARSPRETLERLLGAHIALSIEHRHLIGILTHESEQLPEAELSSLRQLQADYRATWARAVDAVSPEREPAERTAVILGTHSMIYLVVRSGRCERWPDLAGRLTAMAMTLLLSR